MILRRMHAHEINTLQSLRRGGAMTMVTGKLLYELSIEGVAVEDAMKLAMRIARNDSWVYECSKGNFLCMARYEKHERSRAKSTRLCMKSVAVKGVMKLGNR